MNTNSSCVIYAYLILRHHPGHRETETERSHIRVGEGIELFARVSSSDTSDDCVVLSTLAVRFMLQHTVVCLAQIYRSVVQSYIQKRTLYKTLFINGERLTLAKYIICNIFGANRVNFLHEICG